MGNSRAAVRQRLRRIIKNLRDEMQRWIGLPVQFGLMGFGLVLAAATANISYRVISSKRWLALLLGEKREVEGQARQVIANTYDEVLAILRTNLRAPPRTHGLLIVCGRAEQVRRLGQSICAAAGVPQPFSPSFFFPGCTVFVGEHPALGVFRAVLAHELTHAMGFLTWGGPVLAPWIEEGVADFVAAQVSGTAREYHCLVLSGCDRSITTRTLLQPSQTLTDPGLQYAITAHAGVLIQYIYERARDTPGAWEFVRRAYLNQEPEASSAVRCLEQALGMSLEQLDERLGEYRRKLEAGRAVDRERWSDRSRNQSWS